MDIQKKLQDSEKIIIEAYEKFNPTHVVSMVSGGKDSSCSHSVAEHLGIKIDLIIHGRTRCGIPQTSEWCESFYGNKRWTDYVVADAGSAYEDYLYRKGFFGKGRSAHGFAYRVLKATPFRKTISKEIRQGKHNVRILLINGARRMESLNRQANLEVFRRDPAQKNNIWCNIIHNWTKEERDEWLESMAVPLNPVTKKLCRSGECMCGTMQSDGERAEAAMYYPEWGDWLDTLELEIKKRHGFGWGESFPKKRSLDQFELFQPMCTDCINLSTEENK